MQCFRTWEAETSAANSPAKSPGAHAVHRGANILATVARAWAEKFDDMLEVGYCRGISENTGLSLWLCSVSSGLSLWAMLSIQ